MFNITILKMKDIKKYLFGMVTMGTIIVAISNYVPKIKEKSTIVPKNIFNNNMIQCLEQTIPTTAVLDEENSSMKVEKTNEKNMLQEILKTQISSIDSIGEAKGKNTEIAKEQSENKQGKNVEQENENVQLAVTGLTTEVITNNPLKENYNSQYQNIKIKNETSYQLTEDMLKPDVATQNRNIIIYHTHTCESYTSSDSFPYTPTGNFRTTDLNYTVARVGTELETQLKQYQFNVIHDMSYHDYPSYNGSYDNSLQTVEKIVKNTPSDIIIDLHRDAIGSRSDYAPTVKIGETDIAAQMMFVIRNK